MAKGIIYESILGREKMKKEHQYYLQNILCYTTKKIRKIQMICTLLLYKGIKILLCNKKFNLARMPTSVELRFSISLEINMRVVGN